MEQESPASPAGSGALAVLCIDDNEWIGESIARMLRKSTRFQWKAWLPSAEGLEEVLRGVVGVGGGPGILLLDVDIPGQDSFELVEQLKRDYPELRVIMLSGHVHLDLVDRAINAGAWGYVSKNEETRDILGALELVASGKVAFSPAILEQYQRQ